jgi:hypothetical protein
MPAAQAGIAITAPPNRHPTVTEYKYEEIAEIIGKVGKCFCGVFSGSYRESQLGGACGVDGGFLWRHARFSLLLELRTRKPPSMGASAVINNWELNPSKS